MGFCGHPFVFIAGHGEGWALYAERLMHELGYLDDPVYEIGWLSGQALRAALIGYGGPVAVVALDVVENRLNKRGYTLGSLARSRDADVFAIR